MKENKWSKEKRWQKEELTQGLLEIRDVSLQTEPESEEGAFQHSGNTQKVPTMSGVRFS